MGQDPEVIRRRLEKTRRELDETISAIGSRLDVRSRAAAASSRATHKLRVLLEAARGGGGSRATSAATARAAPFLQLARERRDLIAAFALGAEGVWLV